MVWGWKQPSKGWKGLCLHNYINNKSVQFHFIAYSGAQMYVNMHFPCATVFFLMLLHVLYVLCRTVETKIVRREKHNRVKNSTAFYFIFNNLNSNTMALYASLKLYVILIKKLLFFRELLDECFMMAWNSLWVFTALRYIYNKYFTLYQLFSW